MSWKIRGGSLNYYPYHTESLKLLNELDKEFNVVTVVGSPEHGYSNGYDLAIYDTRTEAEIARDIRKIYTRTDTKV